MRSIEGFRALIYLPAARAAQVRPGQPAQITSRALPGATLPGHVLTVTGPASASDLASRYLVTVAITGTHPRLRHGLPVDVSIVTHTLNDVLTVPNTAVIRDGDTFSVDVLEPDGTRSRVPFIPGLIGHNTTEVRDGLIEGQEIVLDPADGDGEG